MLKNKSYIGISFIILLFGIYAIPKIVERFQNGSIVKGERLDRVKPVTSNDDKLVKIGAVPKFELTNQDNLLVTNETYKGKVYVLEFFFSKCPTKLLGVKSTNWNFLTGDKEYIYNLANKGFNLYAGENQKVAGGFEHSGLFALIDKEGYIRCRNDDFGNPILYYDGLDKIGVRNLQQDINILLKE